MRSGPAIVTFAIISMPASVGARYKRSRRITTTGHWAEAVSVIPRTFAVDSIVAEAVPVVTVASASVRRPTVAVPVIRAFEDGRAVGVSTDSIVTATHHSRVGWGGRR